MTEHTPLPWSIERGAWVSGLHAHRRAIIATCSDDGAVPPLAQEANAALIVKAVNSHDRLIQALQFVVDGYDNQDVNHVDFRVRVYEVALDALASVAARPFYGAECPSYPNCEGGCGCGCTKEIERAKASKATEQPHD